MKRLAILTALFTLLPSHATAATQRGDRGAEVVEVQTILHDFGYSVKIDGVFGAQTQRAVKSWQRSNGLRADGVVGPVTLDSLRQAVRVGNAHTVGVPDAPSSAIEHYDIWLRLAVCESGSRWDYNGSSGYDGGLQFLPSTWTAMGGGEFAQYAWQAEPIEQMVIAERTLDASGWGAWPTCARKLGLR